MQHDIEKDGGLVNSKEGLEKNKVSRTADRQKFRYSLYDSEKNSLKNTDFSPPSYRWSFGTFNYLCKLNEYSAPAQGYQDIRVPGFGYQVTGISGQDKRRMVLSAILIPCFPGILHPDPLIA